MFAPVSHSVHVKNLGRYSREDVAQVCMRRNCPCVKQNFWTKARPFCRILLDDYSHGYGQESERNRKGKMRDSDLIRITFKAIGLGKKPETGVLPIDMPTYRAAKKKVSTECWRKDRKTSEGASRYMVPSVDGTFVEFNDAEKSITIIGRGESAVKSTQGRLSLKTTYIY